LKHPLAVLALAFIVAGPSEAQPAPERCGDRFKIQYRLANEYLEAPMAQWIDGQGNHIELWANPKTGTMSLLVTVPGKPMCIGSVGQMFEGVFDYQPKPGDPA
jgi:hypothetical protein